MGLTIFSASCETVLDMLNDMNSPLGSGMRDTSDIDCGDIEIPFDEFWDLRNEVLFAHSLDDIKTPFLKELFEKAYAYNNKRFHE